MTKLELKESLLTRVGWRTQEIIDVAGVTVSEDNQTTDSGLFFQDEHASVTLTNIYYTMEKESSDEAFFNTYLDTLKQQAIILVITDVFNTYYIQDDILECYPSIFDGAISKRLAIIVGEQILVSKQSNRVERFTKEFNQQIFWDLNGNADSSSSRANPNMPTFIGLKSRYGAELDRIKSLLGQEQRLSTFTMRTPVYDEEYVSLTSSLPSNIDLSGFLRI